MPVAEERVTPADALRDFCARIFASLGLPEADARLLADSLVEADLRDVRSHGLLRGKRHNRRSQTAGRRGPAPRPTLETREQDGSRPGWAGSLGGTLDT